MKLLETISMFLEKRFSFSKKYLTQKCHNQLAEIIINGILFLSKFLQKSFTFSLNFIFQ